MIYKENSSVSLTSNHLQNTINIPYFILLYTWGIQQCVAPAGYHDPHAADERVLSDLDTEAHRQTELI